MSERLLPGIGESFGSYTIESLLGRGGMGTVYLATHERLARRVALKVIAPELADDEDFRARFLRESQLAASLDHPNVIPIFDADEVDGVLFIAMRYVSGPSLHARIREQGRLSPKETLEVADQIGGALDAAHRAGLVHRDVKPANILLAEPERHAYLCDFGLAKQASSKGTTRTGSFLGTVDYCAPEQLQGLPLDGRADIYSLGCVVFHCLAGQPPYARETDVAVLQAHLSDPPPLLSDARTDVPDVLDSVLTRALAKDPDDRYATASELASTLARALRGSAAAVDNGATRAAPPLAAEHGESPPTVIASKKTRAIGRPRRIATPRALALGALVLVALIVGVAAVLAIRGSPGSPNAAGPTPAQLRTFVDRVENVLSQSADGRHEIAIALAGGFNCFISSREAGRRIASVADNRQSILEQLGGLPTPTPTTANVVTLLQRSLQQSIEADRHYRDGFFAASSGTRCPLPANGDFALAANSDALATAAKQRFVAEFNPLAERFGRRTWSPSEI